MNPAYREDYELVQLLASENETERRKVEREFITRFRNDLWVALLSWCAQRNITCRIERESACARIFRHPQGRRADDGTATEVLPECDELGRMWLFLVDQSLLRAQSYQAQAPLRHFVVTNLSKPWMYGDYVRQQKKRVETPQVLIDVSPEARAVYRYLRWGYGEEDIALRLDALIEEVRRWRAEVEDRLKAAGQYEELLGRRVRGEVSLSGAGGEEEEATEVEVADEAQPSLPDQVLIWAIQSALRRVIARLPELDREVLDGLYRQGQTAREITEAWHREGRTFQPGETVTQKQIEASVRRSMRTILRELPQELAYFVPEADIRQTLADPEKQRAVVEAIKENLPLILSGRW